MKMTLQRRYYIPVLKEGGKKLEAVAGILQKERKGRNTEFSRFELEHHFVYFVSCLTGRFRV